MPRGSIPTEKEIEEIRRLHKGGYSFRKIADQLGRSYQFVKKYVEEEPRKPLDLTGEITRSCGCLKKDYNKSRNITIKDKGSKKKKIRQAEKVVLKEDYKSEKKYGEVKEYKLPSKELAAYLEELKTKEVQYRK